MASNGKVKKQHRLLEQNPDSKFARALGSVDFHTREAGLAALAAWLSKRHDIEEQELLLLWKGIFYCFWHSDKGAVQAALAERLSEILTQLPEQVGWLYYATFVRTMRREWFGIDRLRLDKFMMLIRKFFAASLRQLQQHDWQPRRVQRLADFWLAEILVPHDTLNAAGVAFHLSDLLLPELANCLQQQGGSGSSGAAPDDATLRTLLEPFCRALAAAPAPALIHRLRQGVFDPLVCEVQAPGEAAALRNLDIPALAAHLFELGSQAEARARNREALYAVSAALEKATAQQAEQAQRGELQKGGKAQQRKEQQRRRQQEQEEQAVAAMEAEAPQTQQHAADAQQQQQQAAGELTPVKSKKGKKRRQAEGEAGAAPSPAPASTPLAAAAAAPAEAQADAGVPPTSGKKKKKSRFAGVQQAGDVPAVEQDLLAAALASVTGTALPEGTPGGDLSPSKKSVRFSLRRNVVNVIGQPPKPADVRTPPTAKPKGSALKREGLIGGPGSAPERLLTRAGMGRMAQVQTYVNGRQAASAGGGAPGSASRAEAAAGGSSKKQKQKRRASLPAPGSFSRPRASEFF